MFEILKEKIKKKKFFNLGEGEARVGLIDLKFWEYILEIFSYKKRQKKLHFPKVRDPDPRLSTLMISFKQFDILGFNFYQIFEKTISFYSGMTNMYVNRTSNVYAKSFVPYVNEIVYQSFNELMSHGRAKWFIKKTISIRHFP